MIIIKDDFDFFYDEEEKYFSEEEFLDEREFGARERKQKLKAGRAAKNAEMHSNRAAKKAAKAEKAAKAAEEAQKAGNTQLAEDLGKKAANLEEKAVKAVEASKRDASFATDVSNKIGRKTPFVVDPNTGVESRVIKIHNGEVTQKKRYLPGEVKKQETLGDRIKSGKKKKGQTVIIDTTIENKPTSAKNPSINVNNGGVKNVKDTRVVTTQVNNVGNEVISASPTKAAPKFTYTATSVSRDTAFPKKDFLRNPNFNPDNAKAVLERRAKEAAEKEAAERAAKEAARNSAKEQGTNIVKEAAPGFFKRNKKALLIGGGVAALGGGGLYGYKKYKDSKKQ